MKQYQKFLLKGAVLLPLICQPTAFAAKPLDLNHQPVSILNTLKSGGMDYHEIKRTVGVNNTVHVRVQPTYLGHPIVGGDFIIHIPNSPKQAHALQNLSADIDASTFLTGTIYQNLEKDLARPNAFASSTADQAMQRAISMYQQKIGINASVQDKSSELVVYVDDHNQAHWVHHVKFNVEPPKVDQLPAKLNYLIDANTLEVYQSWDDIKTIDDLASRFTKGGGFGGNKKMGKVSYDGTKDHLAKIIYRRVVKAGEKDRTCFYENKDVTVKHYNTGEVAKFSCASQNKEHEKLYWSGEHDAVNDGYSPDNDALFGGMVIKDMYKRWYHVPVLTKENKPMMLNMVVHAKMDNAYWDGSKMTFGDGIRMFYPLTSLGVAAHEISHGFTEQHSGLAYYGQSGGMNEAFSDMAAQAAELYAYNKNSWQIGPEIFKDANKALRYMDQPSKDCNGGKPGISCSIDHVSQYSNGLDVHYSSGIYNRVFYLMGTAEGWDAKKAFEVMLNANVHYWSSKTNFNQGACGVINSAKDLGYNLAAVKIAFDKVGIDIKACE